MQAAIFKRWAAGAALLASLAGLSACDLKKDDDSIKPWFRVVNLMPEQASLGVELDDESVFSTVAFETATSFVERDWSGSSVLDVNSASGSLLGRFTLSASQETHYSIVVYPIAGSAQAIYFQDEGYDDLDSGKFVIRSLLASSVLSAYDLYLTGVDESIASLVPTVSGVTAGSLSSFSDELSAGTYRLRLTPSGSKTVLFDSTQSFGSGATYTLALFSRGSATLPTAMLLTPNDGGATVLPNSLSRLRVVQGTPDVAKTRVSLDGVTTYQSIPFGSATDYVTRTAGSRTLNFLDEDAGSDYASLSATLEGGRDYTLFTQGLASAATAVAIENRHAPISSGTVRTSFINATGDQSAVDAIVNYQPLAASLARNSRSDAVELYASVQYDGAFYASANSALLSSFKIDTDSTTYDYETFVAGGDYSMAVVGTAGSYKSVVFKTN